ncbi:MAG TPA: glutamate-cysteine ligase family protein [Myxococcota bacterium]|nr:glutamate-cysteine ligase family protein [Myxococcota bacterium]
MSSHEGSGDATPVTGIAQLVEHHARGEKPRSAFRIGTEHEKFGFTWPDLEPLSYQGASGRAGIRHVLESILARGWRPSVDEGALIALLSDEGSIALEPGGQLELSGQARATVHETRDELDRHVAELERLARELSVRWLWLGAQPVHEPGQLGWMPKRRYGVMRDYLPTRGGHALYMMQSTSTVQANLDYASERDMGRKLRAAMGLGSIVAAIFANSPFSRGEPNGHKSFRASVWSDTDPDRQGLLGFAFDEAPSYEQYVRWALDVPMFFVVRNGAYLPARGQTFRDFQARGFHSDPTISATMEDWELHLSTLFPDARIKTYLETRTADCVPPRYILALPALWKGILYRDDALDAAFDLVKRWTLPERWEHRTQVPRDGLLTPIPGSRGKTGDLARELFAIARHSLDLQAREAQIDPESRYLEALAALTADNRSPADEALAKYRPGMKSRDLIAALLEP